MGAIEDLWKFAKLHKEYEITYSLERAGPEHDQRFTYTYKMGARVIGEGDPKTNKQEAKASAASIAKDTLNGEGHNIWSVHYAAPGPSVLSYTP